MDHDAFVESLVGDLAIITTIADGDLTQLVPACPGWDLARLIGHLGRVHRMALAVVTTGALAPAPASSLEAPPDDHDALRAYYRTSADALVTALRETSPDAPAWTFLGGPDVVAFWSRRQAQEHSIHRWDAEGAIGGGSPIAPELAVDGIDEYFLMGNRHLAKRPEFSLGGTVHLHCTDIEGEWMLDITGGTVTITKEHGKGAAAIRGTASDLVLGLWGRIPLTDADRFAHFGDPAPIAALASLGGT